MCCLELVSSIESLGSTNVTRVVEGGESQDFKSLFKVRPLPQGTGKVYNNSRIGEWHVKNHWVVQNIGSSTRLLYLWYYWATKAVASLCKYAYSTEPYSIDEDEDSDQNLDLQPSWMPQHNCFKEALCIRDKISWPGLYVFFCWQTTQMITSCSFLKKLLVWKKHFSNNCPPFVKFKYPKSRVFTKKWNNRLNKTWKRFIWVQKKSYWDNSLECPQHMFCLRKMRINLFSILRPVSI